MARIDLSFSGWIRGADVTEVTVTATGAKLDVDLCEPKTLIANLKSGQWMIALGDHLYNNKDAEIELFDYEETT